MRTRLLASQAWHRARLITRSRAGIDPNVLISLPDFSAMFSCEYAHESWQRDGEIHRKVFGGSGGIGVNPGDLRALYYIVRNMKPRRILETGTYVCTSTIAMGLAQLANGGGDITTLDIDDVNAPDAAWRHIGMRASPEASASEVGCPIKFVRSPAVDFMRATKERFDFIFLDGDHTAAGVYDEVALATKLLSPNGLILLHDYHENRESLGATDDMIEGPKLAMRRIAAEHPSIRVVPLGSLPWPTKNTGKGPCWTSLAAVVHA